MCEGRFPAMNVNDFLTRHPRHPSLIHIKKHNVKDRRKTFEKLQEEISSEKTSNSTANAPQSKSSTHKTTLNSLTNDSFYKSGLLDVYEENRNLCDTNSNHISSPNMYVVSSATKSNVSESLKSNVPKITNFSSRISSKPVECDITPSPPVPIFTRKIKNLNSKPIGSEKLSYLTDEPYKSTLISKVVWSGIPGRVQEKSDESESGVFLNEGDATSDENSSPVKSLSFQPSTQTRKNSFVNKTSESNSTQTSIDSLFRKYSINNESSPKPLLPPKPPRLLNQLSYNPLETKLEKPKRSCSSVYEFLSNTHSANLPQNLHQNRNRPQKCSTFPTKSPISSSDEKSPEDVKKMNIFRLHSKESSSSIPHDIFLCRGVGVAEMKEKFERQSMSSETSPTCKPILIKKSAEVQGSKINQLLKTSKSKKFVSKKVINNPNYEFIRNDDIITSRLRRQTQPKVTFKEKEEEEEDADDDDSKISKHRSTKTNCSRLESYPLSKKFASVHSEQWGKLLDRNFEEPTYAEPGLLRRKFVSQYDVTYDAAGYAIPSQGFSLRPFEDDDEATDKSIYMRGFSKEERTYVKSKVRDAYSILRSGNNIGDEVSFMTRSVSAGNIPRDGSTFEQVDILEHEKRLNYVSTIRRLTFKNVSRYEKVKSNLNVNLFEYAFIVGLRPSDGDNNNNNVVGDDDDDDGGSPSSSLKTLIVFSWPESLSDSELNASSFCFPDAPMWQTNPLLSGEMFSFFLTTSTGDRKFCWCLRYLPPDSDFPEAVCVVSAIGEAGFYQQLLNGVRQAREHSHELAQETLKSAQKLKFPRPNKELYINAVDREGFKYTGVLKRLTESHYSTAKFGTVVRKLPISLLIQVVATILLERRVILLAQQLCTLSSCILSLSTLLYPFSWPHTLVTVLPPSLHELVHSPTPYILGMFSSYKDLLDDDSLLDEVLVVDLDEGYFLRSVGDEGGILPKKIQKALMLALSDVPGGYNVSRSSGVTDVTITEAFLRMFVEMCGHYNDCVTYSPATGNIFQKEEFVKAASSNSIRLFLDWFSRTQIFQVFISDRMKESFVSDLFDQRIEEYRGELENIANNPANMKIIKNKFVNFFKNYGTKLKKSLKKNAFV